MSAGDIYFYTSSGSVFDRAICLVTSSRFVHVAIGYDNRTKIEMLGQGCAQTPCTQTRAAAVWNYPLERPDPIAFAKALDWLEAQVGRPYGWNDAIEALDKSHRFLWLQTGHLDCSHLAAEFLSRTGYNVEGLGNDLARVTPGQLGVFLGMK